MTSSNDAPAQEPLYLPLPIKFTEKGDSDGQLIELCIRNKTFMVELGPRLRKKIGTRKAKVHKVLSRLHEGGNTWADRVWIQDGEEWKVIEKEGFTREYLSRG